MLLLLLLLLAAERVFSFPFYLLLVAENDN